MKEKPNIKKKKVYKVQGTSNQKKVAQLIVEDTKKGKKVSGKKILEKIGYSKGMCKNAGKVINSKGVKKELKKLGFDPDSAKLVVGQILANGEENNRIAAAREIFKVHGTYAAEKTELSMNEELRQALDRLSGLLPKAK